MSSEANKIQQNRDRNLPLALATWNLEQNSLGP